MKTYEYNKSHALFERAAQVIPGGIYGHLGVAGGRRYIPASAYPLFAERAEGAYFWDVDGNRFLDYMAAYGPNVLGYNDREVNEAAIKQAAIADCTTLPSSLIVDLAELMVDTVASADWAFFAKNGGDVTTLAVMSARAATGRKKIIFLEGYYHGVAPWAHTDTGPGILEEEVSNNILIPWDDLDALEAVIREHKEDIAGLIATPYYHTVFDSNQLPAKDYWQKVRKLCTDNGIVLIFDDIRCGFRLDMAGSDHYFGIKADLICFCKAIANGWNLSALCGTDALKSAVQSVFYTGSYWMSAVPFAAAIATINKLKRINGVQLMNDIGTRLTSGLSEVAKSHGFNMEASGAPSLFYLHITDDKSMMLQQDWAAECVKRGVFFSHYHNMFTNCAIGDEEIKLSLEVADEAFKAVKVKHPQFI
ncbi:aminotransferase class III-fold pyridoxal phosphate-dependent enzyme [Paenibacillus barcinonensis]|uniref:Aminotransferase class III-fold pyridoxal phosphate-dependent enzyme n=1 Tax=Paenibacillus barcinonensis TaxID=198119 RepID=A0A2V4V182_PAEBA|nr:aminotransferase class III-fold pyridoxal phosphate-dependent enzyme [Paenibacillus barcinonensis]PYE45429.1 glutamate-1-semialdehyde 2,1-aminomutase [Paenibacillus barcinonensis]QKS55245.1 aminotransferase class III-fold pyridoxal phosphate-dependent enzyme [Paenibacillus barcinonensis]